MVSLLAWKPAGRLLLRWARGGLAPACLLLLALPAWAAPKFQTSLDRDNIRLGETVTLSMTFQDGSPDGQPSLPPISGLAYGSTGQATQAVFDGSGFSQTTTFTVEVRPTRAGNFTIPALTITINGARLTSRPLKLSVVASTAPQAVTGDEPAFVRLIPATNTIYLGQTIPVEVQCYCNGSAVNLQLPQLNADDFIVSAIPRDPQRTNVRVGGSIY